MAWHHGQALLVLYSAQLAVGQLGQVWVMPGAVWAPGVEPVASQCSQVGLALAHLLQVGQDGQGPSGLVPRRSAPLHVTHCMCPTAVQGPRPVPVELCAMSSPHLQYQEGAPQR